MMHDLLLQSFEVITRAAHPDYCIKNYIPAPPAGRLIVVGAGKASAAMAAAFESHYDGAVEGLVMTRYGHSVATENIRIIEAAHPIPDQAGQNAVAEMLSLLRSAGPEDLIVCLISGGGSSLLSRPVDKLSFDDLRTVQKALLGSGASIHEMNIVRKHLNIALGGGLAQAARGSKMITLAISDVVGDDPSVIASGASVADPSTLKNAREVLERYGIDVPAVLHDTQNETPKPDDDVFAGHEYHMIATPKMALHAAQDFWESQNFDTHIWDGDVEGDSEDAAQKHVSYLRSILPDIKQPTAILSGGETTVRLTPDSGDGGPNTHFMLQAAILLQGHKRVYGMACDTDGIDGSADNAGAIITPDILENAAKLGLDPTVFLAQQSSYAFFDTVGELVKTGATYTNVNDYRVFLLLP